MGAALLQSSRGHVTGRALPAAAPVVRTCANGAAEQPRALRIHVHDAVLLYQDMMQYQDTDVCVVSKEYVAQMIENLSGIVCVRRCGVQGFRPSFGFNTNIWAARREALDSGLMKLNGTAALFDEGQDMKVRGGRGSRATYGNQCGGAG